MIKQTILTVGFLLAGFISFSQQTSQGSPQKPSQKEKLAKNKEISFDFANPQYPAVTEIKSKQSVELVLKNINPYLYEVTLNDSLIVFQSQQPPLFGQIFKISNLNIVPTSVAKTTDTATAQKPNPESSAAIPKKGKSYFELELEDFLSKYSRMEINVRDVLSNSKIADDINKLLTDCYSTLTELKAKADAYITNKLPKLASGSLPIGIQTKIDDQSNSIRRDIEQYAATGEALKKGYYSVLENRDPKLSFEEYRSIEKGIKEKTDLIDKILDNVKKLLAKLDTFDEAKVGENITDNYNKIMTSRIEKRFIRPTLYNTDEVVINVHVKKKKDIYCAKEIGDFPVNAIVIGGVKIDFSTGIVFNMGNTTFFDQKYHYDSVYLLNNTLSDSVTIVRNKNRNQLVPSLGVFFHVYPRCSSHINIGGMFGASLGTDQRVYYNLGGSLIIGKSDRLIIGFGMSIAKATILDGQYSENQKFKRSVAPTTISTEDATRIGGFFSISWNLNLIK